MQKVVLVILLVSWLAAAEAGDGSATGGELLLKFGQDYNKPLFKLIGKSLIEMETKMKDNKLDIETQVQKSADSVKAFVDEICDNRKCTEWSEWSKCVGNVGDFNMTKRTRVCGVDTALCKATAADESETQETESRVCEVTRVTCPGNYTSTKHGFCLSYYSEMLNNSQAEDVCQGSGGHLVNVNSQMKSEDVSALQIRYGNDSEVWIDGYRATASSAWQYRYGETSQTTGFSSWDLVNANPDNDSPDLCQLNVYDPDNNTWFWWSESCSTYASYFICEYVI